MSIEAVRKRVKRGSLQSDKGPDGRVYVYLDAGPDTGGDTSHPQPEAEASELVEELRRQNEYLRRQLDVRTDELREHRRLLAAALERIPELEAQQEPQDQPESAGEEPQRSTTPEEPERRAWWRRWFGG